MTNRIMFTVCKPGMTFKDLLFRHQSVCRYMTKRGILFTEVVTTDSYTYALDETQESVKYVELICLMYDQSSYMSIDMAGNVTAHAPNHTNLALYSNARKIS